jgi:hypothetical protein
MVKKISLWLSGAGAAIVGLIGAAAAHAQSIPAGSLTVPTSTVSNLLASVSNVFTDPGILGMVIIAAALPIVFWFARQVIGLLPKSRAAR